MSNNKLDFNMSGLLKSAAKHAKKQANDAAFANMVDTCRTMIFIKTIERLLGDKDLDAELKAASVDVEAIFLKGMQESDHDSFKAILDYSEKTTAISIRKAREM